jgi:hypothetical protein
VGRGVSHAPAIRPDLSVDLATLKWPHIDHYIWPHLTDRSAYPICEADGEGDGLETQGGAIRRPG